MDIDQELAQDLLQGREDVPFGEQCKKALECGGHCCLRSKHLDDCECAGDDPGEPGTCPA